MGERRRAADTGPQLGEIHRGQVRVIDERHKQGGHPGEHGGPLLRSMAIKALISNWAGSESAAAWDMGQLRQTVRPKEWEKGIKPTTRSPPYRRWGSQALIWATLAMRLPWLSMAALGMPVVPPVYCKTARSPDPGDGLVHQGLSLHQVLEPKRPGPGVKPLAKPCRRALKG